jgi:hypothetical protein
MIDSVVSMSNLTAALIALEDAPKDNKEELISVLAEALDHKELAESIVEAYYPNMSCIKNRIYRILFLMVRDEGVYNKYDKVEMIGLTCELDKTDEAFFLDIINNKSDIKNTTNSNS